MKCLVLGGTRFVGKKLVQLLLKQGVEVTIANRGMTPDPFGNAVKRIKVERTNPTALTQALSNETWDIVYDQICFSPDEAMAMCEALKNRTKRLIFTSSQSVYDMGAGIKEETLNPAKLKMQMGSKSDFNYQDGKKMAEAVFAQKATFPTLSVRLPIILGEDDYTRRLEFHIDRICSLKPIFFPNPSAKISLISSDDAARFLFWLGSQNISGPINGASPEPIILKELISFIEKLTNFKAIYSNDEDEQNTSPLGAPSDWFMNVDKAKNAGYKFQALNDWLPALVTKLCQLQTKRK